MTRSVETTGKNNRHPAASVEAAGAGPNPDPENDLITVTETAALLRLSRRTVERLVGRGELPFYTLPVRGGLRFSRQEVLNWVHQRHRDRLE